MCKTVNLRLPSIIIPRVQRKAFHYKLSLITSSITPRVRQRGDPPADSHSLSPVPAGIHYTFHVFTFANTFCIYFTILATVWYQINSSKVYRNLMNHTGTHKSQTLIFILKIYSFLCAT